MKFEIKNRWSGKVQFTAEIEADENTRFGIKVGLAMKWAHENKVSMRAAVFTDAVFTDAVFTDAVFTRAVFTDADFTDAVFTDADFTRAVFTRAVFTDAVFTRAVFTDAVFTDADFTRAVFTDADFTRAVFTDVPRIESIHQAVYAAASKPGCLNMEKWHACETTHCRAGWVVHLAGDEGRKLESRIGTPMAATLIYLKSDPKIGKIPNFYANNDDALADMKRLAELEQTAA